MKRKKKLMKKFSKYRFSKKIVIFCIIFIVLYTIIQTYLSYRLSIELSPTLTTCVYAFFGTELAASAVIRIFTKDIDGESTPKSRSNKVKEESTEAKG